MGRLANNFSFFRNLGTNKLLFPVVNVDIKWQKWDQILSMLDPNPTHRTIVHLDILGDITWEVYGNAEKRFAAGILGRSIQRWEQIEKSALDTEKTSLVSRNISTCESNKVTVS